MCQKLCSGLNYSFAGARHHGPRAGHRQADDGRRRDQRKAEPDHLLDVVLGLDYHFFLFI